MLSRIVFAALRACSSILHCQGMPADMSRFCSQVLSIIVCCLGEHIHCLLLGEQIPCFSASTLV
jgi:hypothetical protein